MTLTCNKNVNIDNDWLKIGIGKVNIYIETLLNFGVFWCSRYWYTCICTLDTGNSPKTSQAMEMTIMAEVYGIIGHGMV